MTSQGRMHTITYTPHPKPPHADHTAPCGTTVKPLPPMDPIVPGSKSTLIEDIPPYATYAKIQEHKQKRPKSATLPLSEYSTIYGTNTKADKLQSPTSSFVVGAAPYGMKTELKSPLVLHQPKSPVEGSYCTMCKLCGQSHSTNSNHLYDYHQPVDEDLTCHVCLQPLVEPVDTKCGHTFCYLCLHNYLKIQSMCPVDRSPVLAAQVQQSSIMVRR